MSTIAIFGLLLRSTRDTQRATALSGLLLMVTLLCAVGCGGKRRDISDVAPYSEMLGRIYRVVGNVEALAIIPQGADEPEYLSLFAMHPPYAGPEVAFRKPIARGATFRISKAEVMDTVLDDSYYYLIEFQGTDVQALPVHLRLRSEFRVGAAGLNSEYFERVR